MIFQTSLDIACLIHPPRYRFQPSRIQYRFPSSPSRRINFSHRPSLPDPITSSVCSSTQPITPLGGRPRDPLGCADPEFSSSPISKCALATEYTSENTRGRRGSLPRMPHFWLDPSSVTEAGDWLRRIICLGWGISKICRVDLSDVTASREFDGENERENITAWSTPRRSSASFVQFAEANTLIRVP